MSGFELFWNISKSNVFNDTWDLYTAAEHYRYVNDCCTLFLRSNGQTDHMLPCCQRIPPMGVVWPRDPTTTTGHHDSSRPIRYVHVPSNICHIMHGGVVFFCSIWSSILSNVLISADEHAFHSRAVIILSPRPLDWSLYIPPNRPLRLSEHYLKKCLKSLVGHTFRA